MKKFRMFAATVGVSILLLTGVLSATARSDEVHVSYYCTYNEAQGQTELREVYRLRSHGGEYHRHIEFGPRHQLRDKYPDAACD